MVVPMALATFRDLFDQIGKLLREHGCLGAVLVDLAPLAHIERSFGGATYSSLRSQIEPVLLEMRDRFRQGDFLTRDEREGDRFLLFLGGRRNTDPSALFSAADLRRLADRVEEFLQPRIGRLILPYRRERPVIDVGYALVLSTPLENDERQVLRLIDDVHESLDLRRKVRDRDQKEQLLELIYNRQIWTAFQPIVEMESRQVVGWEGLSRGPRGSDLEPPLVLFGRA